MTAKILQLTDLHVEPRGRLAFGRCDSAGILDAVAPWLREAAKKVDALVVTGDIGCSGSEDAYRLVKAAFEGLPCPVRMIPGNHDRRAGFEAVLKDFVQNRMETELDDLDEPKRCDQILDLPDAKLILLDTLQPGKHWGALPDVILDKLEQELRDAALKRRHAIVFTHHTPLHCGMGAMDEDFGNRRRFLQILNRHPQTRLATGHMHRSIVQLAGRTAIASSPSVACPIEIDLSPAGGGEFRLETPGFALHHWTEEPCGAESGWSTFFGLIPIRMSFEGPFRFCGSANPAA